MPDDQNMGEAFSDYDPSCGTYILIGSTRGEGIPLVTISGSIDQINLMITLLENSLENAGQELED